MEDLGGYLAFAWLLLLFFVLIPIFIIYPLVGKPLVRVVKRWRDRRRRQVRSVLPVGPVTPQYPDPGAWAFESFGISLDSDQAGAVGLEENSNALIAARAGSGKTRVLTTRALWLQDVCGVAPSELLLVAFNKPTAEELKDRLQSLVGEIGRAHV